MSKRNKSVILLLIAAIFCIGSTFAWFVMTSNNKIDDLIVNIGKMEAEYKFYIGNDPDRNGELNSNDGQDLYALTNKLEFGEVLPGDIFSFKVSVKSLSDYSDVIYFFRINKNNFLKLYENDVKILDLIWINFAQFGSQYVTLKEFFDLYDGYFFKNKAIAFEETQDFYFKLKISENMGNEYQGLNLQIKNLEIYFDQR